MLSLSKHEIDEALMPSLSKHEIKPKGVVRWLVGTGRRVRTAGRRGQTLAATT
jgi:hypothetical protein